MDAQQMHDYEMSKRMELSEGSRERLEALLATRDETPSSKTKRLRELDPISMALMDHPTLTRQKAEVMEAAFGG